MMVCLLLALSEKQFRLNHFEISESIREFERLSLSKSFSTTPSIIQFHAYHSTAIYNYSKLLEYFLQFKIIFVSIDLLISQEKAIIATLLLLQISLRVNECHERKLKDARGAINW